LEDMFVVQPAESLWFGHEWEKKGKLIADDYRYTSNTNDDWLSVDQLREIIGPFMKE